MNKLKTVLMAISILALASCSYLKEKQEMKKMNECKTYFESVVKELSDASKYYGRNAYENGDIFAAKYIIDQVRELGAIPASKSTMAIEDCFLHTKEVQPPYKGHIYNIGLERWSGMVENGYERTPEYDKYVPYLQNFSFDLNVMRGNMKLVVDGKEMEPTVDYIAKEFSPTCQGKFEIKYLDDKYYTEELFVKHLNSGEYRNAFVVVDWAKYNTLPFESHMERYIPYLMPLDKVGGIIIKDAAGSYSPNAQFPYFKARAHYVTPEPVLMVNGTFPDDAKELEIDMVSQMYPRHDAHNVVAFLPGTGKNAKNDECITFIAHYDHLGCMGRKNVFPGANDNASGVAMLLSFIKYWSGTEHSMPLQFIFLDAEESNLLGAFFYAANPVIPLDKIKCVINCDMVGDSGDNLHCQCEQDGQWIIDALKKINDEYADGFKAFDLEGVDDNSDHYAFEQAGVPSTYFETKGEFYDHYHTPRDTYEHFTSCNYHRLFHMFTTFVNGFNE